MMPTDDTAATDRDVACSSCGYANPADHSLCFICGRSLRTAPARRPAAVLVGAPSADARRAYRAALADESHVVAFLRLLYTLYLLGYVSLLVSNLVLGATLELDGPHQLLILLFPLLSLAVVALALRRVEEEPFAWALVMAGMETLAFLRALTEQRFAALHGLAMGLLWLGVLACARAASVRRRWAEGTTTGRGDGSDLRVAASLLLLYGGVLVLLLGFLDGWDLEDVTSEVLFWSGIVLLGVVAALLAGSGVLRGSLRFSVRLTHVLPFGLVLLGLVLTDTLLLTWTSGSWMPDVPTLEWPGTAFLLTIALAPGLCEEWLCRGVMWSCVRERLSTGPTILATATLFALLHGLTRGGGLSAVGPQLIAGVLLGLLRARTGSLVPCMAAHAASNLYVGAWLSGWMAARVGPLAGP